MKCVFVIRTECAKRSSLRSNAPLKAAAPNGRKNFGRREKCLKLTAPTPVDLKLRSEIIAPQVSQRELPVVPRESSVVERERVACQLRSKRTFYNRSARAAQEFQIIGVLNKLYVLMENADGLVLVDQHAAHERILFEELRRRMEEQGVPSQKLLIPQTFDLSPRDAEWVERNLSILQKMGIGIESFGPNTFKIDSLPAFLRQATQSISCSA